MLTLCFYLFVKELFASLIIASFNKFHHVSPHNSLSDQASWNSYVIRREQEDFINPPLSFWASLIDNLTVQILQELWPLFNKTLYLSRTLGKWG